MSPNWPNPNRYTGVFLWLGILIGMNNEQSFDNLYLCGGSCSRRKWHMGSSVFFSTCQHLKSCDREKKSDSKVYPMYDGNRKLSARTWLPGMNVIGGWWQDVPGCTLINIESPDMGLALISFHFIESIGRKRDQIGLSIFSIFRFSSGRGIVDSIRKSRIRNPYA